MRWSACWVCRQACAATNGHCALAFAPPPSGVFLVSALVNALFGFAAMLPYGVVVGLAMAAAFIVQGNFSNLTSGLLAVAEPQLRGAIVAVYSCIGFAGGFDWRTLLFGLALDWFGGTARLSLI